MVNYSNTKAQIKYYDTYAIYYSTPFTRRKLRISELRMQLKREGITRLSHVANLPVEKTLRIFHPNVSSIIKRHVYARTRMCVYVCVLR